MNKNNIIFSTKDFAKINWHDCKIHGLAFDEDEFKFYLDIDLILEWIEPSSNEDGYKFKLAPATLIFRNVWSLVLDIDTNLALDIDSVFMQNYKNKDYAQDEYNWNIVLYIRKPPEIRDEQSFVLKERGGVSFSM